MHYLGRQAIGFSMAINRPVSYFPSSIRLRPSTLFILLATSLTTGSSSRIYPTAGTDTQNFKLSRICAILALARSPRPRSKISYGIMVLVHKSRHCVYHNNKIAVTNVETTREIQKMAIGLTRLTLYNKYTLCRLNTLAQSA